MYTFIFFGKVQKIENSRITNDYFFGKWTIPNSEIQFLRTKVCDSKCVRTFKAWRLRQKLFVSGEGFIVRRLWFLSLQIKAYIQQMDDNSSKRCLELTKIWGKSMSHPCLIVIICASEQYADKFWIFFEEEALLCMINRTLPHPVQNYTETAGTTEKTAGKEIRWGEKLRQLFLI